MRVHRPVELVKFLLERDKNDAAGKVDEILQKHQSLVVPLKTKVPILVEYVTVSTNEQGKAVFYTDPYNTDVDALAQLTAD
jgi:murein L,D-transpeptidase YcbB/YkuD